ncbi:hypothetical protein C8T65DRAFT_831448 [Cerioporus squamosus]|nr:hypothetical protein C8T65DRAFT_831448 [Cerioporus squamosus]
MAAPIIPFELQELVIDLVDDSWDHDTVTATLLSCTLTCRAWLPPSRRRLYHSLFLRNTRTRLDKLVDLIDRDLEVSNAVRALYILQELYFEVHEEDKGQEDGVDGNNDSDDSDEGGEENEEDERAEKIENEEIDDKGADDQEDRNDRDQQQHPQREMRPVKVIVRTEAVLRILARKLPHLASLGINLTVIDSSPPRPPMLAGFPALTTLKLSNVTISSYGALQRMLAATPALERLIVFNVLWTSIHISPTIQYFRLRCPSLTHLVWHPTFLKTSEQTEQSSVAFSHLVRNLNVCRSLEYLYVRNLEWKPFTDRIIAGVTSDRFPDSLILRSLSTLRLSIDLYHDAPQEDNLSDLLESAIRLIKTLWPSGNYTQRRRTLRLKFAYESGTLTPVIQAGSSPTSLNPTEDELERLLQALQDVSMELEHLLAALDSSWGPSTVEFMFQDGAYEHESAEILRAFIVSLRSRVADIFPGLHRRGILSVKFASWIKVPDCSRGYNWVEDSRGNFEGIPFNPRSFFE